MLILLQDALKRNKIQGHHNKHLAMEIETHHKTQQQGHSPLNHGKTISTNTKKINPMLLSYPIKVPTYHQQDWIDSRYVFDQTKIPLTTTVGPLELLLINFVLKPPESNKPCNHRW